MPTRYNPIIFVYVIFSEEDDEDYADKTFNKRMAASMISLKEELEIESKYGIDTPLAGSVLSLHPGIYYLVHYYDNTNTEVYIFSTEIEKKYFNKYESSRGKR